MQIKDHFFSSSSSSSSPFVLLPQLAHSVWLLF